MPHEFVCIAGESVDPPLVTVWMWRMRRTGVEGISETRQMMMFGAVGVYSSYFLLFWFHYSFTVCYGFRGVACSVQRG